MLSISEVKQIAMAFEGAEELPHFEIISFRIKKKIFATLNITESRACLKLSLIDQDVFTKTNSGIIYTVPNAWGRYGWTLVNLKKVRKSVFKDAITCAFCNVAPKKISMKYQL